MRRLITLPLLTAATVLASLLVTAAPAAAHGYISTPQSRQAYCAANKIESCGEVIWEPWSVEALKGSTKCSGGSRFRELDDETRDWPATRVGGAVQFTWSIPVPHSTRDWEYLIGGTRVAHFVDKGRVPGAKVTHTVDLSGHSGRVKLLARWNIADTDMAFYNCVDLEVGGAPEPRSANAAEAALARAAALAGPAHHHH
ncbi:hypothetical protein GCM10010123_32660 [Pilimelia anulata]|uniref:Chitin-binding type-4 domain-containing protein n=1 Tax=Pilimelia anulata TaxID=53371 RepID=A0A8J3BDE8_9ACTN|nr:lytic polysaccharide monooxygenase auxiliary activity family 9 protein [Pilimelia anulata]GGK00224.1 hypothetical protein GCM10010123_32660 [Pilimelia anulata]